MGHRISRELGKAQTGGCSGDEAASEDEADAREPKATGRDSLLRLLPCLTERWESSGETYRLQTSERGRT